MQSARCICMTKSASRSRRASRSRVQYLVGVAELVAADHSCRSSQRRCMSATPTSSLELDISPQPAPLSARLLSGELDIVFIPGDAFDPSLVAASARSVAFRWMAGADNALPARPLAPADFADLRILSLGENSIH